MDLRARVRIERRYLHDPRCKGHNLPQFAMSVRVLGGQWRRIFPISDAAPDIRVGRRGVYPTESGLGGALPRPGSSDGRTGSGFWGKLRPWVASCDADG
jgi:hypothetical protein